MEFKIIDNLVYTITSTDVSVAEIYYGPIATPEQIADPQTITEEVEIDGQIVKLYRGQNQV